MKIVSEIKITSGILLGIYQGKQVAIAGDYADDESKIVIWNEEGELEAVPRCEVTDIGRDIPFTLLSGGAITLAEEAEL